MNMTKESFTCSSAGAGTWHGGRGSSHDCRALCSPVCRCHCQPAGWGLDQPSARTVILVPQSVSSCYSQMVSSAQFRGVTKHQGRPTCAPPPFSEVFRTSPLKQVKWFKCTYFTRVILMHTPGAISALTLWKNWPRCLGSHTTNYVTSPYFLLS